MSHLVHVVAAFPAIILGPVCIYWSKHHVNRRLVTILWPALILQGRDPPGRIIFQFTYVSSVWSRSHKCCLQSNLLASWGLANFGLVVGLHCYVRGLQLSLQLRFIALLFLSFFVIVLSWDYSKTSLEWTLRNPQKMLPYIGGGLWGFCLSLKRCQ